MLRLQSYHLFITLMVGLFLANPITVNADIGSGPIACTQVGSTINDLNFGTVNPFSSTTSTSATINYECRGSEGRASTARICYTFGPLNTDDHKLLGPNNTTLAFDLFSSSSHGAPISKANPLQLTLSSDGSSTLIKGNITVYAQTLAGQTQLVSGDYTLNNQIYMTVNSVDGSSAPNDCLTITETDAFTYTSQASVAAHCAVTTAGVLDLGRVSASTVPTKGSATNLINVTCTNTTFYNIGLAPSNKDINGQGVMTGTNAEPTLPYQLQSDASGTEWGNNGNTYAALTNGVTGTGDGAAKAHTVYVTVPNTDVTPDTYSDTVTVTVYY
ncbi:hypothetical protein PSYCG_09745 [Psychrobacter sp. G]|uniref:Csu type fimbrial protein n=1 Tax=Psychrobacter sp. G TaxID=571800 RepID=UPI000354B4DB|nr:spore coat protein U domain-containing protein [Psychrobacter sp. G]AGP49449.1 hypothetical protein PSYCG_09745 [Psychrobacter sp. G]